MATRPADAASINCGDSWATSGELSHAGIDPENVWTFKACEVQPDPSAIEFTHHRKMPLPIAIQLGIAGSMDPWIRCVYSGHGVHKVVYQLPSGRTVLKLTEKTDAEPFLSKQVQESCNTAETGIKICPSIGAIGRCQELDREGRTVREWFAWLAEYAIPLDQYMICLDSCKLYEDRKACVKMALYKQVIAALHGMLLDSNNVDNFGIINDTVVIIDLGKKPLETVAIAKGTMNEKTIHKWWNKLKMYCKPDEVAECSDIWEDSGNTLEEVATKLKNVCFSADIDRCAALTTKNSKQNQEITTTPEAWALLEPHTESSLGAANQQLKVGQTRAHG